MKYLKLNRLVSIEDIFVGDTNTFVIVNVLFNVKPVFTIIFMITQNLKEITSSHVLNCIRQSMLMSVEEVTYKDYEDLKMSV